jgi:hypothetical protein
MTSTNQQDTVTDLHPSFTIAEQVAPEPASRDEATVESWVRHYAALALAAHAAFRDATATIDPNPVPGSRPDLDYLMLTAVSATAAAVALTTLPDYAAGVLWDLTPEAGALNGEYIDWLAETLDGLGVNPADVYGWYDAADFTSASTRVGASA